MRLVHNTVRTTYYVLEEMSGDELQNESDIIQNIDFDMSIMSKNELSIRYREMLLRLGPSEPPRFVRK